MTCVHAWRSYVCILWLSVFCLFIPVYAVFTFMSLNACVEKNKKKPKTAHTRTLSIFTLVSGHEVSLAIKSHYQPTKWT